MGVDADPLLLRLAELVDAGAVRYVGALLGEPGWLGQLSLDRPVDAVVSTTALRYLDLATLDRLYRQLAGALRPGGSARTGWWARAHDDSGLRPLLDCAGRGRCPPATTS